MSRTLIDAFFTVTDEERQIGYAIQGGRVARWDWNGDKALDTDAALLSRRWPRLPESFTEGFDATLTTPSDNPWTWVFRDERCLRLNPLDGTVAEVATISARFPGLPAVFTAGLDASLPGPIANQVYLFRGDRCALYDLRASNLIAVGSLADTWSGLAAKAPEFVAGISAATVNPKSGLCYLFRGGKYTRGTLATGVIDLAASAVDNTSWVGLMPAFARGHVIVPGVDSYSVDLETHNVTRPNWGGGWRRRRVEVSPDGRYIHVLGWEENHRDWHCHDMATGQEVGNSGQYSFMRTQRMTFSPEGGRAYFVRSGQSSLCAVGLNPPRLLSEISIWNPVDPPNPTTGTNADAESDSGLPVPDDWWDKPAPVVLSPDARRVYAGWGTDNGQAVVSEVDLDEQVMRQPFTLPGPGPIADLAISADGRLLHVALPGGVCALDLLTGQIVLQGVLPACTAMALTPDKRELWCLPTASNTGVLVTDPVSHRIVRRIPIGGRGGLGTPSGLAFSHFGTYAYTTHESSRTVAVIDAGCYRKIASIVLPYAGPDSSLVFTPY